MTGQFLWKFNVEEEKSRQSIMAKIAGTVPPGKAFERIYRKRDGTTIPVLLENKLLKDEEGRIIGMCSTTQDITERKRAEEALKASKELFEKTFISQRDAILLLDAIIPPTILDCNPAAAEIFGYTRQEMVGRTMEFLHVDKTAREFLRHLYSTISKHGFLHQFEFSMRRKDGTVFPTEHSLAPLGDEQGSRIGWVSVVRDITERKRAENEIKKLNEELERRVLERTAQLEATSKDMQKEITERKRAEGELKKHEDHLEELVEERTQKIRELEEQRTEIEKLAAAGLMAAQIAHEINNPLAGIKNSFLLVKDAIPQDHPYYGYVGRIETEINRIARIVRQMFDVYRPEQEIKKEFSVNKAIYDVVALLEAAWRENNITIEIDSKPITMEMPEGSLRQVLYNIVVNAIEASPQGGVVKVMTEADGEVLILSITDQGAGIPLEAQSRIFEPFFTKKHGSKKGLGLGLSVSKDIVERMGGHIDFESEAGKGTIFRIILPLRSGRGGEA